jgi:hypothetical protein
LRAAAAVLVGLALLAATGAVAWWVWVELGNVSIGLHGWIALAAGAAGTLLVGSALILLMHISSRRGFDDRAGRD